MKKVYGYIRVSTAKQGEGVSLIVQQEAITRYAAQYNLEIIRWFEEKETAARQGRPLFTEMMKLLKAKKACGVVIHKIDRSARNLKDWAELGNLIDQGVEVHFAHESLDLHARGGRLSADIQAVIAADYIRNLRQETIKGLYGRLNQGIWPFQAPVGYLNTGKGNYKVICPNQGPLVRKVFELYATEKYSLRELLPIAQTLGLKTFKGTKLSLQGLSLILKNPFYIGILKARGGVYNGGHKPLISPNIFHKVQAILKGGYNQKIKKHEFVYRKLITCASCGYKLIPERQKGFVYYRCHTKNCPTKAVRESRIERRVERKLAEAQLMPIEWDTLQELLQEYEEEWITNHSNLVSGLQLQKSSINNKLERLTDCYIEQGLDKTTYESRKSKLLFELKEKEAAERNLSGEKTNILQKARNFLERTKNLINSFETEILAERRELVKMVTSNFVVEGKKLGFTMVSPFYEMAERHNLCLSALTRNTHRKTDYVFALMDDLPPLKPSKPLTKRQLKSLFDLILEAIKDLPDDNSQSSYEL